jgi:hypothetical protein
MSRLCSIVLTCYGSNDWMSHACLQLELQNRFDNKLKKLSDQVVDKNLSVWVKTVRQGFGCWRIDLQDVEVLVHMARRRCMDDKAAVRKAGLQLLEALLMMRARGAGGADVELPAEQDIRALEAATADALVRPALLCCI